MAMIHFHNISRFLFRYKGRIIYNTRYQESNSGQQQVVAGGGISGSASLASTSTPSSGAAAINGCSTATGESGISPR